MPNFLGFLKHADVKDIAQDPTCIEQAETHVWKRGKSYFYYKVVYRVLVIVNFT